MSIGLILAFVLGIAMMVVPLVVPGAGMLAGGVISVLGLVVTLISGAILVFTSLFKKTRPEEALVVTGGFGSKPDKAKVVVNGGTIVLPFMHEVTWVGLSTMKLDVHRMGKDALLTGDKLRANVIAQFYIKVMPDNSSILTAARTLARNGRLSLDLVKELVDDKLVAALRDVSATKTLGDLNADRSGFGEAVQEAVQEDLQANGLHLESVAISSLDQTPLTDWDPENNAFDAEGYKHLAVIVAENTVAANAAKTGAAQKVEAQNVERDQELARLRIEREQANAAADAAAAKAHQDSLRAAGEAEQRRDQGIAVAAAERQQAESVALQTAQREEQVAEQQRLVAVEDARREHAEAEARRAEAEAEAETSRQKVKTVEETATADRDRQVAVIGKESEARQAVVDQQGRTDAKAYEVRTMAEANQEAAVRNAEATRTSATASRDAASLKAEGDRAVQMVPVDVQAREVEVLRDRLEAQAEHQEISKELEIRLAEITADKEKAVAFAQSYGQALAQADITIWGDPDTMHRIAGAFTSAQEKGAFVEGLLGSLPEENRQQVTDLIGSVSGLVQGLTSRVAGSGNSSDGPPTQA